MSKKSVKELAEENGIHPITIRRRMKKWGCTAEEAAKPRINITALAKEHGLSVSTLRRKLSKGIAIDEAIASALRPNISKLAREKSLNPMTVWDRIKNGGMTIEQALNEPVKSALKRAWENEPEKMR